MIRNFEEMAGKINRSGGSRLAVAASHDEHTLEAVFDAEKSLGITSVFVGDKEKTFAIARNLGMEISEDRFIDAASDEDAAAKAVALVRDGRADALMKGKLQTATLLRAVLNKENGIRSGGLLSHLAAIETGAYGKLLFMTDGGMNTHPDLAQKKLIVENSIRFMATVGYAEPKVAALAAVETVSDKMPETLDAKALQDMSERGEIPGCILEGPLSFDLAVSKESAMTKGISGRVAGQADLLLVPDIASGNIMSKALTYLGGAKMAGLILGAKVPIILVSRGASAEEKRLSIMMGLCG
jgi:phosphate butyryltransferase